MIRAEGRGEESQSTPSARRAPRKTERQDRQTSQRNTRYPRPKRHPSPSSTRDQHTQLHAALHPLVDKDRHSAFEKRKSQSHELRNSSAFARCSFPNPSSSGFPTRSSSALLGLAPRSPRPDPRSSPNRTRRVSSLRPLRPLCENLPLTQSKSPRPPASPPGTPCPAPPAHTPPLGSHASASAPSPPGAC